MKVDGADTRNRRESTGAVVIDSDEDPVDRQGPLISVAIMTSGGDAPGMNAAVRSCVAMCLAKQARVYTVTNGYKGLVSGGENIKAVCWTDVAEIMQIGGTIIGTARCAEMRTREGRLSAARNLALAGISR